MGRVMGLHVQGLSNSIGHDNDAFRNFCITEMRQVRGFLDAGFDVLMSDTDIVWERDPAQFLYCNRK